MTVRTPFRIAALAAAALFSAVWTTFLLTEHSELNWTPLIGLGNAWFVISWVVAIGAMFARKPRAQEQQTVAAEAEPPSTWDYQSVAPWEWGEPGTVYHRASSPQPAPTASASARVRPPWDNDTAVQPAVRDAVPVALAVAEPEPGAADDGLAEDAVEAAPPAPRVDPDFGSLILRHKGPEDDER